MARNVSNKYAKQLLDWGLDALRNALEKVAYKAAQATGEFMGNKTADQNCETWWKVKKCWRNNYSTSKKRINIKWIKTTTVKMEPYEISNLLHDSIVSKFVTRK